jgi:hypothetical protein
MQLLMRQTERTGAYVGNIFLPPLLSMHKQRLNIFIKGISHSCLLAHDLFAYTTHIIQLFLITPFDYTNEEI